MNKTYLACIICLLFGKVEEFADLHLALSKTCSEVQGSLWTSRGGFQIQFIIIIA